MGRLLRVPDLNLSIDGLVVGVDRGKVRVARVRKSGGAITTIVRRMPTFSRISPVVRSVSH